MIEVEGMPCTRFVCIRDVNAGHRPAPTALHMYKEAASEARVSIAQSVVSKATKEKGMQS
jgi:hypothetical protein